MQNSSFYSQIKTQVQQQPQQQFPDQEHLKCPRCDSENTKFCYYNNYNLSQPRHFCKSCKRYWTKGGALRKIPVGGASRKNAKRSSAKRPAAAAAAAAASAPDYKNDSKTSSGDHEMAETMGENFGGQFGNFGEVSGSLSSILGSSEGQFGNFLDGLGPNGNFTDSGAGQNVERPMGLESGSSNNGDGFLSFQGGGESGHWSGDSNSWPDLAIYTPGSTFQ